MRKRLALVGVIFGPATLALSAITVAKLAFLLAIFFITGFPSVTALILLLVPIFVISLTSFIAGGPSEGLLFFL